MGGGEGPIPRYSVTELNRAVGLLLERGFAPRFLLDATVSRPQLKKGHLWLTLVDEQSSISAVVWASQLARLSFQPAEGDGVVVVGKLNFWGSRANLSVQVLDIRPSLSSVLRRFEQVRDRLAPEGLFDPDRKRPLPERPGAIALLTSVPSSALADMVRTAAERWPATRVVVVPIPVQGAVEEQISRRLEAVAAAAGTWGLEAIVLARGGGSREDLAVFDSEAVARAIARCPLPLVTGLGHEDDVTVADLVADYRAATPTAAIVALLPHRQAEQAHLNQLQQRLRQIVQWRLEGERRGLEQGRIQMQALHPQQLIDVHRRELQRLDQLLQALSPQHLLERGFALVRNGHGSLVRSITQVQVGDRLVIQVQDGQIAAEVRQRSARPSAPSKQQA